MIPKLKYGYSPRIYPDHPDGPAPSVTSICNCLQKYALVQWAADCAVDYIDEFFAMNGYTAGLPDENRTKARTAYKCISEQALNIGTNIHDLCELYLRLKYDELDRQLAEADEGTQAMLANFRKFCVKHNAQPIMIEQKVFGNNENGYRWAGRFDVLWEIDSFWDKENPKKRVISLDDIKTSKAYYPEMPLQLAAYRWAWEQQTWVHQSATPQSMGIIRIDKTSHRVNYKHYEDYEHYRKAFSALKDFYWIANNLKEQFEGELP